MKLIYLILLYSALLVPLQLGGQQGPSGGGSTVLTAAGGTLGFAYSPQISYSLIDLTMTGTTTILSVTESGRLIGVYLMVGCVPDVNGRCDNDPTGTPDVDLTVAVDGDSFTQAVYNGTTSWVDPTLDLVPDSNDVGGRGTLELDKSRTLYRGLDYSTSLSVSFIVNSAATAGTFGVSVVRAPRIADSQISTTPASFLPEISCSLIDLSPAVGTTTEIVNVTEAGILRGIFVVVEGSSFPFADKLDVDLRLTLDGVATTLLMYDNEVTWAFPFQTILMTTRSLRLPSGDAPPGFVRYLVDADYHTSLLVEYIVGAQVGTEQENQVCVLRLRQL